MDSNLRMLKPLGEFKAVNVEAGKRLIRFISKADSSGMRDFPESVGAIISKIALPENLAAFPGLKAMLEDCLEEIQTAALRRFAVRKDKYLPESSLGIEFLEDYAESIRPVNESDIGAYFVEGKVDGLLQAILEKNPSWPEEKILASVGLYKELLCRAICGKSYAFASETVKEQCKKAASLLGMPEKMQRKIAQVAVAAPDAMGL